jgi:hypothetical protein
MELQPDVKRKIIDKIEKNLKINDYARVGWAADEVMGKGKATPSILNKIAATLENTGKYRKEREGEKDWGIVHSRAHIERAQDHKRARNTALLGALAGAIATAGLAWWLQEPLKPETIVLPEIQIVHDTIFIDSVRH